jgi:hypothetical protein
MLATPLKVQTMGQCVFSEKKGKVKGRRKAGERQVKGT